MSTIMKCIILHEVTFYLAQANGKNTWQVPNTSELNCSHSGHQARAHGATGAHPARVVFLKPSSAPSCAHCFSLDHHRCLLRVLHLLHSSCLHTYTACLHTYTALHAQLEQPVRPGNPTRPGLSFCLHAPMSIASLSVCGGEDTLLTKNQARE